MRIVVQVGNESGQGFSIDSEMTAGRAGDNDIVLSDADISSYHARLAPKDGGIEVTDSNSRNGTFVNGERITAPKLIRAGDELRLGAKVTLIAEEAATAAAGAGSAANSIVVRTGRDAGAAIVLGEGVAVTIGREPGNTLVLSDTRVSSRHARVTRSGRTIRIEDLGSANGTLVNGKQITGATEASDGAEVQLGESVLVYYTEARAAQFQSQPTIVGSVAPSVTAAMASQVEKKAASNKKLMLVAGIAGVVVLGGVAAMLALTAGGDEDKELAVEELIDLARPSVMEILNKPDPDGSAFYQGTGSVVDAEKGLVLTNNHVATGGTLSVLNENIRRPVDAVLIGAAPCDDLAVIQVIDEDDRETLKAVTFGDAEKLRQGQQVIALGFPASAESGAGERLDSLSATSGIISKSDTIFDSPGDVPKLSKAIQHQAAVNPGNSGGPLFDITGKQIGVNTAIYSTDRGRLEGANYAVSVERLDEILPKLKEGSSPKWIGASLAPGVTNSGNIPGLIIEGITPDSPAEDAKLQEGEMILEIDGEEVYNMHTYCDAMPTREGDEVTMLILGFDGEREVDIVVGRD